MARPPKTRSLTMRAPGTRVLLVSAMLVGSFPAWAGPAPVQSLGRWYQESDGELPSAKRLVVRSQGDISVARTGDASVRYEVKFWVRPRATDAQLVPAMFRDAGVDSTYESNGTAHLVLRGPACTGCRVAALLEIHVPQGVEEVDLQTHRGDIRVQSLAGTVKAHAVGGSIRMDSIGSNVSAVAGGGIVLGRVGGSVDCETAGGLIHLGHAGESARLATGVGSLRVGSVGGDLEARTQAGSIDIARVAGRASIQTLSGSIQLSEAGNDVLAQVGAGDIRIRRAAGDLDVTTSAGNIAVGLADQAVLHDSVLTTGVGSVFLLLPENFALTLVASVQMFNGRESIVTEFPSIEVSRSRAAFGKAEATGSINGGGPVLRTRTGMGRIEVRRRK